MAIQKNAKRIFKDSKVIHLGDYHDLYVQIHTLLLGDVFENFKNFCLEIYALYPAHTDSVNVNLKCVYCVYYLTISISCCSWN